MPEDLASALAGAVLPADERLRFLALCSGRTGAELARDADRVAAHVREIERAAASDPTIDALTATRIGKALVTLMRDSQGRSFEERRLISGAAEYFVLDRDGADDYADLGGLEDDARVARAVCHALGRDDLARTL